MQSPKGKPTLDADRAIELMRRQLNVPVESLPRNHPDVDKWFNFAGRVVAEAFGEKHANALDFTSYVSYYGDDEEYAQSSHQAFIRSRKALLESFIEQLELFKPVSSSTSIKVHREGIFFAGQSFDALMCASEILSDAKKEVILIDAYISEAVLKLLTKKQAKVDVKILTTNLAPAMIPLCSEFNKQYGGLSVRCSTAFHDRFIFIDDQQFYHFGASIKDVGRRAFMFSLIEQPEIVDTLRNRFSHEWAAAKIEI